MGSVKSPSTMCRSVRQTPQARTRMSTCSGPGRGAGTSRYLSGRPGASNTMAMHLLRNLHIDSASKSGLKGEKWQWEKVKDKAKEAFFPFPLLTFYPFHPATEKTFTANRLKLIYLYQRGVSAVVRPAVDGLEVYVAGPEFHGADPPEDGHVPAAAGHLPKTS